MDKKLQSQTDQELEQANGGILMSSNDAPADKCVEATTKAACDALGEPCIWMLYKCVKTEKPAEVTRPGTPNSFI